MNDTFHARVYAASVAAWWTFLIGAAFLFIQWLVFLGVTATEPAWAASFWGPGATWESIRTVWFQALLFVKLTLWPLVLVALWLTLWARRLRARQNPDSK
jgi:hypothetical protein